MKPIEYRFYILGYITMLVPDEKGDQIQFQREIIETPVFWKFWVRKYAGVHKVHPKANYFLQKKLPRK